MLIKEKFLQSEDEWVYTHIELPPDNRVVEVWIKDEGVDKFGYKARFIRDDYDMWMSEHFNWVDWTVIAWKRIKENNCGKS